MKAGCGAGERCGKAGEGAREERVVVEGEELDAGVNYDWRLMEPLDELEGEDERIRVSEASSDSRKRPGRRSQQLESLRV